ALGPSSFAMRMEAEIGSLEIEHAALRNALGEFVEATRTLADRRRARDEAALDLARAHDRLRRLRVELDEAYLALGEECEHGIERCLVLVELDHVVAGISADQEGLASAEVRAQAARIRGVMSETAEIMQSLFASQVEIRRLKAE